MAQHKRHFKVTVNGKNFDVEVEELSDTGPIGAQLASRPAATPAVAAAPVPTAAPATAPGIVVAPMAGKVLKVPVSKGDAIKAGQVVVVLEAMKMETDVLAAADGIVAEVHVKEGDAVEAGAALVKVE